MPVFDYSHGATNTYTVEDRHDLIPPCMFCGERSTITMPGSEYFAFFVRGELVQRAMPSLTAAEREHVMTGTHPACWDKCVESNEETE